MIRQYPSAAFFTHTATVYRASAFTGADPLVTPDDYPVDDAAGRNDTLVAVSGLTALPACIQPEGGRERWVYSQRGLQVDTSVYFRGAVDAQADDVLEDDASGRRYLVVCPADEAEQGRVSWFLCRRLA